MEPKTSAVTVHRDKVQEIILKALEACQANSPSSAVWKRPWEVSYGTPCNHKGTPYIGGNSLLLSIVAIERGYRDGHWITYRQAEAKGWQVRKGEKGVQIEWWQWPSSAIQTDDETIMPERRRPWLKVYTVFNQAQVDGMPEQLPETRILWEEPEVLDTFLGACKAPISQVARNKAMYAVAIDTIFMPPKSAFTSYEDYVATLFHELVHWTGPRLERPMTPAARAMEEAIAELGSFFLLTRFGIPADLDQTAAYLKSWEARGSDLFAACRAAWNAVDYLSQWMPSAVTIALEQDESNVA